MSSSLVEVGRYRGKVVDHDIGKSSKGTPQVAVQFERAVPVAVSALTLISS